MIVTFTNVNDSIVFHFLSDEFGKKNLKHKILSRAHVLIDNSSFTFVISVDRFDLLIIRTKSLRYLAQLIKLVISHCNVHHFAVKVSILECGVCLGQSGSRGERSQYGISS